MKKYFFGLILLLLLLSGCNKTEEVSYELCGYGNMVSFDGVGYVQIDPDQEKYRLGKKVGVIQEKIEDTLHPINHLTSNFLTEGSALYISDENKNQMIAKENGKYFLFEKISY